MILYDFIAFYKPFAAKCPPAGFFYSTGNTSPDLFNMSFHDLVYFHCFWDPRRPLIYVDFLCFLLALNQVGRIKGLFDDPFTSDI